MKINDDRNKCRLFIHIWSFSIKDFSCRDAEVQRKTPSDSHALHGNQDKTSFAFLCARSVFNL
jgi:hypothetical protein